MNEKFNKGIKIVDVVLKVLFIICVMSMVAVLIAVPLILTNADKLIAPGMNLSLGGISFNVADTAQFIDVTNFIASIISGLIGDALYLILFTCGIYILRKIIAPMKDGRPFDEGISGNIKKLSIVILIAGFVGTITEFVASTLTLRAIDIDALLVNTPIEQISINTIVNGNFIVTALIIYLLSYVFRYGEALQKESDETL